MDLNFHEEGSNAASSSKTDSVSDERDEEGVDNENGKGKKSYAECPSCSICFEEIKPDDIEYCRNKKIRHPFHVNCLRKWKKDCPVCRASLRKFIHGVDDLLKYKDWHSANFREHVNGIQILEEAVEFFHDFDISTCKNATERDNFRLLRDKFRYRLARLLAEIGRIEEACELYEDLLKDSTKRFSLCSAFLLAGILEKEGNSQENQARCRFLYEKIVGQSESPENVRERALIHLAPLLADGIGGEKDEERARAYFIELMDNPQGSVSVRDFSALGLIKLLCDSNDRIGFQWAASLCQRLLESGYSETRDKAQYYLASMLTEGKGIAQDLVRARRLLSELSEKSDVPADVKHRAQFKYVEFLKSGYGGDVDYKVAEAVLHDILKSSEGRIKVEAELELASIIPFLREQLLQSIATTDCIDRDLVERARMELDRKRSREMISAQTQTDFDTELSEKRRKLL